MTNSMFASIKDSLAKPAQSSSSTSNILRLKTGNTYTIRLLPYTPEPSKTFFHYFSHGWVSEATGQFQSSISPQTWGERDPIAEARFRIMRTGSEEEKEKAKALTRREQWLINVYVVKDPENPENEGKVKILRFGKQLHKIIMEAIEGDDADEFGEKIFSYPEGCNLRVKVEEQGGYPSYVTSRFASPSEIPGLSEDGLGSLYEQAFELDKVYPVKSYDELVTMLNEHYYGKDSSETEPSTSSATPTTAAVDDDDDLDFGDVDTSSKENVDSDKVKELLDTLD
tara:strand:- start:7 stop:855 length:849 start_codon:yes stop_codon:yes gene_type:complete